MLILELGTITSAAAEALLFYCHLSSGTSFGNGTKPRGRLMCLLRAAEKLTCSTGGLTAAPTKAINPKFNTETESHRGNCRIYESIHINELSEVCTHDNIL